MPDAPWIMLLYSLPSGRGSARVNVWRKLKKSGALPYKSSAYLLPNRPELLERFQWLAKQVTDAGGEASVAFIAELEGLSNQEIVRQFHQARAADYAELDIALKGLRKRAADSRLAELEKIRRQFQEIWQIDFFESPAGAELAARVERAAENPAASAAAPMLATRDFRGKTWLTRPRPAIDRVGSAWLIRGFIDPEATFVFGSDPALHAGAIAYDMSGGEFTHHGDDCTFETLLKRFGLSDPALVKIGRMIHDADLDDGKFGAVEAIGLDRVFKGWGRLGISDEEIFARGFPCFDALHESLQ